MKVIVVTGSTRGIGFGLVNSFLNLDCQAVLSGRSAESVDTAKTKLLEQHDADRILAHPCDVTQPEQLQGLWDRATEHFGKVDIWINNAGIANDLASLWEVAPEQMAAVVNTNVLGSMFGSRVALNGMLAQGNGALYNMEGMGSTGRKQAGMAVYGTTKAAIRYLNDALILETDGMPVIVGSLSPGMVATALVFDQFREQPELWQRSKRALSVIMDDVETVTPWLAQRVLRNEKHGARIAWLTRRKLAGRFMSAPLSRRPPLGDPDDYETSRQ